MKIFEFCALWYIWGVSSCVANPLEWQLYAGEIGPGNGRSIVLISGDEEYRSEETIPQLAKILAKRHGFDCAALFAQNPEFPGVIDPNYRKNIPGMELLDKADLVIVAARFRTLPNEQMEALERYLMSGKPIIGLRTSTHAFKFKEDSKWAHWSHNYEGSNIAWHGGFGQVVLGATWINHHGWHGHESTRGILEGGHEIGSGIEVGTIWSPTDVYTVPYPLPDDHETIVLGQVLRGMSVDDPPIGPGPYDKTPSYGKNDPNFHKNRPMMPIAWTKTYRLPDGGEKGKVFATTLGASVDLEQVGVRRLLVNAVYWSLDIPIPARGTNVDLVGDFAPTMFEKFKSKDYWRKKNLRIADFGINDE